VRAHDHIEKHQLHRRERFLAAEIRNDRRAPLAKHVADRPERVEPFLSLALLQFPQSVTA